MGKPHPIELRERVVCYVKEGHTHRSAAAHFRVAVSFVNDMVKLRRETGSLKPKKQGNPGAGKLSGHHDWVRARMAEQPDLTLDALVAEFDRQRGVTVHRASVGNLLHRLGLSNKKNTSGQRAKAP